MTPALLFTTDLFFSSRVIGAGQAVDLPVTMVGDAEKLLALVAEQLPRLVLLDLTCPACRPAELVPALRAAQPEIAVVAFGPHVQTSQLEVAQAAGCDEVFTRGQFDRQLPELLARYAGN